ncbi:3-deoxy-D-manno-octulosonic acid transferase [Oceaniglobus trochenteri]|uniref:3-deoxy-D-manno-octulosonic acid transferase n=1 Tax=Oceaniglobus trochenteri TaxID=2763260 RepID=UPI001CFFDFBA|nr:glycosyltransferase N-terminal domain-containing protein [Oceaniglobus trochenteri]
MTDTMRHDPLSARAAPSALPRLPWSVATRVGYGLYQVAAHLLLPAALILVARRARREPLYRANLRHRFGLLPRVAPGGIWVFAASLGETRAVTPLLRELIARGHRIVLSHSAPAGLEEGRRQFGQEIADGRLVQTYMPVDVFWALRLALRRIRPVLALVVEAEIWPAHIVASLRAGVPVVKVNANLTERAFLRDGATRAGRLRLFFLRGLSRVLTKTPAHIDRYSRAGVDPSRIVMVGELKFDLPLRDDLIRRARELCPTLTGTRAVWMIASSIEAEEEDLHRAIRALHDRLSLPPLVVWAPRSPQRFGAVARRLAADGWTVGRRSEIWSDDFQGEAPAGLDVLVADSLGEMDFSYALADVVFVGATLADMGGHNVNEPLALERPVVTGPSVYAIPAPAEDAIRCGALRVCGDGAELAETLVSLFGDPDALTEFRARAAGLTEKHLGAARRSADALLCLGVNRG